MAELRSCSVLGVRIDSTNYEDACARVLTWADSRLSRYVCVSNVHVTMEAHDSPEFREVVNSADLVTPDGTPLVWALRLMGVAEATHVRGATLTMNLLKGATAAGVGVGFYGSTSGVLDSLAKVCRGRFPALRLVYMYSPPFRELTPQEDRAVVEDINASGAQILFVGLGCPRQERWMSEHRGRVNAVMLGVGAAFDFLAGQKRQAPLWMQEAGLEWVFRLAAEPGRLWRRYVYHNPRFLALAAAEISTVRSRMRKAGTR